MKLNLTSLEDKKAWEGYKLFNYNCKEIEENTKARPQWIHFGAGNIFRIFPAGLCQKLLNESLMDTGCLQIFTSNNSNSPDLLFKLKSYRMV